jgi:hypothetical protein
MLGLRYEKSAMYRYAAFGGLLTCASSGFASWIYANAFFPDFTCPIAGVVNSHSTLNPTVWLVIFAFSLLISIWTAIVFGRFFISDGNVIHANEAGITVNGLMGLRAFSWEHVSELKIYNDRLHISMSKKQRLLGGMRTLLSLPLRSIEGSNDEIQDMVLNINRLRITSGLASDSIAYKRSDNGLVAI